MTQERYVFNEDTEQADIDFCLATEITKLARIAADLNVIAANLSQVAWSSPADDDGRIEALRKAGKFAIEARDKATDALSEAARGLSV